MPKLVNRAKMTTATTGTGTMTLGVAVPGFQNLGAAGVADGNVVRYTIEDGNNWEVGSGTYTASGTTLSRTPSESSSGGAAINLSGGAVVYVTVAASDLQELVNFAETFTLPTVDGTNGQVLTTNGAGTLSFTTVSGGGSSPEIGQVVLATSAPTSGTWLETGKYYSKATYSALASAVGNVPDISGPADVSQAILPFNFSTSENSSHNKYVTASDGTTTLVVGQTGAIRSTTNGVDWTPVVSRTTTNLREVVYLNNHYIITTDAFGGSLGSFIMYSSDGETFTFANVNAPNNAGELYSVAYGSGRYVFVRGSSVSGTSSFSYSTDLKNWTAGTFPSGTNFARVIFANSLFVTVGSSSCFTSSDGITWTGRTIPSGTYRDVIYANGLYVAYGNNIISTSSDGITWTSRTTATWFRQVIYANSLFVAVGDSGNIFTSSDGITWTSQTSGVTSSITGVCWNGTNFVAVTTFGRYLTSSDGVTWTVNVDASYADFNQVAVVDGKTLAFGNKGAVVLAGATRTTPLLIAAWSYTVAAGSAAPNPRPIAYNGSNQYVVVGTSGAVLTSADGQSWTARDSTVVGANLSSVFYLNGNYVGLAGAGTSSIITSADGITWTASSAIGAALSAAAYGASTYVVVGAGGTVRSSTDLLTWTSQSAGSSAFNDVIFANSLFVAVGAAGAVYTSSDGTTWTSRTAGSTQFNRVIYDNGLFVAVGNSAVIYTSSDGVTWTLRTSNANGNFMDIVWNGSIFCAVTTTAVVVTSPDGTTWTARVSGIAGGSFNSVAWSGTRFVASNTSNVLVWTSTDGITWDVIRTPGGTSLRTSYLGGRFVSVSNGVIQTSSDGLTWRVSDQVQYVPTGITRLWKLNGYYYVTTNSGTFYSSDGVSFSPIREGFFGVTGMAYGNSKWIAIVSGNPGHVYTSTNGTTWTLASSILPWTESGYPNNVTLLDCEYANGKFLVSASALTYTNGRTKTPGVYTSSDAITWSGGTLPYGFVPSGVLASDGTIAATATSTGSYVAKTTDGGSTWSLVTVTNATPTIGCSGGVWVLQDYASTDLDNLVVDAGAAASTSTRNRPTTGFYVHDSKFVYNIQNAGTRFMSQADSAPLFMYTVPVGNNPMSPLANMSKEYPLRGTTLLFGNATPTNTSPFLIGECPLYSYDTSTTFWVPPQGAGGGQKAYIYAGA